MSTRRLPTVLFVLAVPVMAVIAILVTRAVEGPTAPQGAVGSGSAVVIKDFSFRPATLSVARGSKLKITNGDGTPHTFSAADNGFSTPVLDAGGSASIALESAGSFPVVCKIHPNMTATVVVT